MRGPAPLQDIGGKCVSPSTVPWQPPKPNGIAGIKSGMVQIWAILGDKEL